MRSKTSWMPLLFASISLKLLPIPSLSAESFDFPDLPAPKMSFIQLLPLI